MTKSFWAGVMIFSIVVTGAAAGYLFFELRKRSTVEVPLQKMASLSPPEETDAIPAEEMIMDDPAAAAALEDAPSSPLPEQRNIGFVYHSAHAKDVAIIGDFNDWFATPLKKSDKSWSISIKMDPGTYEYMYKVDGKRVQDPYNKRVSENGKSLLTVEPLN